MSACIWAISLFFSLLHSSDAVKCLVCNSKQDVRCSDPFKPSAGMELLDCDKQSENTRKSIEDVLMLMRKLGRIPSYNQSVLNPDMMIPMACQKLDMIVTGEQVTGRGCSAKPMGYYHPCDAIKAITNSDIILKHCSLCDEDGCNSSQHLRWTPQLVIATVALIRFTL